MPFLPSEAAWIEALRRPMLMDASRARRELHWMPHHDARETLRETIAAVRAR
jgi:nucleoside-diphosphate-sugar epimerase